MRGESSIGVRSVNNGDDDHAVMLLVDPVDHPVRTAAGAVPVVERRAKSLADPMRVVKQRADDEVVRRERNRLRKAFS
jgi:hypothetical protein